MSLDARYWQERYLQADTNWDLGGPTPVFQQLRSDFPGGRVLIPGAGRGYDAIAYAAAGFQVTTVDLAPAAVAATRALARAAGVEVRALEGDFFALQEAFDLVLEQTFLCALEPTLRDRYFAHLARVIRPGGLLCALVFPTHMDGAGPPFVVRPADFHAGLSEGFTCLREEAHPATIKPRAGREVLMVWQRRGEAPAPRA